MVQDDSRIIQECQNGDQAAFEVLVDRYKERAYWIAYDLVSDHEAARDISQEAFIRVFRKIRTFDPHSRFSSWLSRIVVNLAIDHLRARRSRPAVSLEDLPVDPRAPSAGPSPLEAEESRTAVRKVLDRMPEKYRTVLVLKEINSMSSEEIAKSLGRPALTIRWRLHAARKMFKDIWERIIR
jgi:RNA polymerase sigma-70 factor (ECF subfamily)